MNCFNTIEKYYNQILNNIDEIVSVLTKVETYETVMDEINRSLKCIREIDKQEKFIASRDVDRISVYLPLNQPLYSMIIFVIVPSMMANIIDYRPPESLRAIFLQLHKLLDLDSNIRIYTCSREKYLNESTKESQVVIFTGKHSNAVKIREEINDNQLFIFNGSALNPIIVTENADLDIVASHSARERLFNSGQDCMAPCAFFIHNSVYKKYIEELTKCLDYYKTGDTFDKEVRVGQMLDIKSLDFARRCFSKYDKQIIYGGEFNYSNRIIKPTIIEFDSPCQMLQTLIFAPIFLVSKYSNFDEILKYLTTSKAQRLKGYISVYGHLGKKELNDLVGLELQVIQNNMLFDYEDGNSKFGGYGLECSSVTSFGTTEIHPILISQEISRFINE